MDKEKESGKREKYEDVYGFYQQKISGKTLIINKKEITVQDFKKNKILKRRTPL